MPDIANLLRALHRPRTEEFVVRWLGVVALVVFVVGLFVAGAQLRMTGTPVHAVFWIGTEVLAGILVLFAIFLLAGRFLGRFASSQPEESGATNARPSGSRRGHHRNGQGKGKR